MSDINKMVGGARNSSKLLKALYNLQKSRDSKISLQYLCSRSGISSKGYLSDVFNGKRKLKPEYAAAMGRSLGLNPKQNRVLALLIKLERERNSEAKLQVMEKLMNARKALEQQTATLKGGDFDPFVFVKVFCSIGITGEPASLKAMAGVVGVSIDKVSKAVDALLAQGWIKKVEQGYVLSETQVMFNEGGEQSFHHRLTESYLKDIQRSFSDWLKRPDEAFIHSTTISVSEDEYRKALPEIRRFYRELFARLETNDADQLVHVNTFFYPDRL